MNAINSRLVGLMAQWEALKNPTRDEDGQTLVEYGLIIALISIVAIGVMATVGTNVVNVFTSVSGKLHS